MDLSFLAVIAAVAVPLLGTVFFDEIKKLFLNFKNKKFETDFNSKEDAKESKIIQINNLDSLAENEKEEINKILDDTINKIEQVTKRASTLEELNSKLRSVSKELKEAG